MSAVCCVALPYSLETGFPIGPGACCMAGMAAAWKLPGRASCLCSRHKPLGYRPVPITSLEQIFILEFTNNAKIIVEITFS